MIEVYKPLGGMRIQPRPTELNDVVIRKSQWRQWKLCPQLYEYVWIQDLPTEPGVEQQYGQIFHYNAKVFFDHVDAAALLTRKHWEDALAYFVKTFSTNHPVIGKWMQNFLEFEAKRWHAICLNAADPVKFWLPYGTEVAQLCKQRGFMMHIDRIDRLSTGNLINIEYKTDKYWNLSALRSETTFYNIGINAMGFDIPCTHIGCYNPQLNRAWSEEVSKRTVNAVNRSVLQFRRNIVSGVFEPRPQRYCRYCAHNFRCLESGYFEKDFIA